MRGAPAGRLGPAQVHSGRDTAGDERVWILDSVQVNPQLAQRCILGIFKQFASVNDYRLMP